MEGAYAAGLRRNAPAAGAISAPVRVYDFDMPAQNLSVAPSAGDADHAVRISGGIPAFSMTMPDEMPGDRRFDFRIAISDGPDSASPPATICLPGANGPRWPAC